MPEITDDTQPAPRPAPTNLLTEEEVVRRHFLDVCEACDWNLTRTANLLGLSTKTAYNRIHRYEDEGHVKYGERTGWERVGQSGDSSA